MSEIPQVRKDHDPSKTTIRRETYADGSVNAIADKVGDAIDFNNTGHKYLNLNPSSILDIAVEQFDEGSQKLVRIDYVITEGGYGPGAILTSVKGERGITTQVVAEYNEEWISALRGAPLVIGSRPSRFYGAKLKSVSAAMRGWGGGDGSEKTTANPIMIGLRAIDERNERR